MGGSLAINPYANMRGSSVLPQQRNRLRHEKKASISARPGWIPQVDARAVWTNVIKVLELREDLEEIL